MKIKIISGLIMLCFIYEAALTQDFNEVIKLNASDSLFGDNFSWSLDISGNYAVIGAYGESEDAAGENTLLSAGSAYIFERNADGNWIEVQKIVPGDRAADDHFGGSVAISANYIIVGAEDEDEDEVGENTFEDAGSAYIFERNGYGIWEEVKKIVASDRASTDHFGKVVDISGNYAVVGTIYEDEDSAGENTMNDAGSVYIFERDEDGLWNEVQKIVASDRSASDNFGYSLCISGNYVVVGAANESEDALGGNTLDRAGSAYIFKRGTNGIWSEVQKIVASDRYFIDHFGYSVGISGNYIIVSAINEDEDALGNNTLSSAGSAYIFECDQVGTWTEVQKIVASDRAELDNFGRSTGISGDRIIIGTCDEDEDAQGENTLSGAGSAYIFEREGNGNWNQVQKIVASDRKAYADFGASLNISGDYAIVGAFSTGGPCTGSAYIFESCTPNAGTDPDNIIDNGNFETCILLPWYVYTTNYLGVTANAVLFNGTCTISGITLSASPEPWDAQLKQELSPAQLDRLEEDSVYVLSFDASAETDDRPCRVSFEQSVDPWVNIMNETIVLGQATQSYSFEFVLNNVYSDMQLSIQVGTETSNVTFDNAKLARKPAESVTITNQAEMKHVVLFPNPASEYVTIIAENGAEVKLYNSVGFTVKTGMPSNNRVRFNIAELPAGVYIVEIAHEKSISVSRVFIR